AVQPCTGGAGRAADENREHRARQAEFADDQGGELRAVDDFRGREPDAARQQRHRQQQHEQRREQGRDGRGPRHDPTSVSRASEIRKRKWEAGKEGPPTRTPLLLRSDGGSTSPQGGGDSEFRRRKSEIEKVNCSDFWTLTSDSPPPCGEVKAPKELWVGGASAVSVIVLPVPRWRAWRGGAGARLRRTAAGHRRIATPYTRSGDCDRRSARCGAGSARGAGPACRSSRRRRR